MPIPADIGAGAGVGLKPEHYEAILSGRPALAFVEIHAENYMGAGGPPHHYLTRIRETFPVSLHGVGLSIGAERPLDRDHLKRLRALADRYQPGLFSEHLAWSTHDGAYYADLLPVAYDTATLARVAAHIDEVQTAMGRRMLLENPSTYIRFDASTWSEIDFLAEIVRRTGCGLLLDVNNVEISAANHGYDPFAYLDTFPAAHVGEMHLGGFARERDADGGDLLIDSHGAPVDDAVWRLHARALQRCGPTPTLIEWDNDVPDFATLHAEAMRADGQIAAERARRDTLAARGVAA